jgi:hopanoid biosynthesis associated RND transporter like protein HpnN
MTTPRLDGWLWRLMAFGLERRLAVILGWALLTALAATVVATRLSINTDSADMIDPKSPFRVAAAKVKAAFPDLDDNVVVLIEAKTPDEAAAFTEALAPRLARRSEIKALLAPPADPFFTQNGLLFLEVSELEDLLSQLSAAAPLIERLGEDPEPSQLFAALSDAAENPGAGVDAATLDSIYGAVAATLRDPARDLSWQNLLGPGEDESGRVLLTIDPVLDYTKLKPARAVRDAILAEAEEVRARTGYQAEVLVTGEPVLRTEELETVSQGIGVALAVSALLVAALLYLAFRNLRIVGACLVAVALSVILTAGVGVLLFGELNLISVAFAVLMVGLGADFSIHLLLHTAHEAAAVTQRRPALYRTTRKIGGALILAAPTTALAFFSFAPTAFIGMNQLGIIAGLGVLIAFLVAMTLLPALLRGVPREALLRAPAQERILVSAGQARMLGLLIGGLGLASILMLPLARFDADPMALRAKDAPSVVAFSRLAADPEDAPYRLSVLARDREELAQRIAAAQSLPEVGSVRHLFSFVPEDQELKRDLIDTAAIGLEFALLSEGGEAPPLDAEIARLRGLLGDADSDGARRLRDALSDLSANEIEGAGPRLFRFWPQQRRRLAEQLAPEEVDAAAVPLLLRERYLAADGTLRLEILPEGGGVTFTERQGFVSAVLRVLPDAAGGARTAIAAGEVIGGAMIQASVTAAVLVALLVLLVLRSWRLLLLVMVPLVLAGALTTAAGTLFGIPYNFANVLVLPLIMGIGIDSGLHLALAAERRGDALSAIRGPTGRAVIYSALTTIVSFGSLALSAHRGTASMGILLTIGMLAILATMLFVLPPLAALLYERQAKASLDPIP